MTVSTEPKSILAQPLNQIWYSNQFQELQDFLVNRERNTVLRPTEQVTQLELNQAGYTVLGNRRISQQAFRSICNLLGRGLRSLWGDLSGIDGRGARVIYSLELAIQLYNSMLHLRHPHVLSDKQILCDDGEGTIDGILSHTHQRLSNHEFFEQVETTLAGHGFRFEMASMLGRRLSMHYYYPAGAIQIDMPAGSDFWGFGIYFTNSEAGDCSVRQTNSLVRHDGLRILSPYEDSNRLIHAGKDFRRRLSRFLGRSPDLHEDINWDQVRSQLTSLAQLPLGFTGTAGGHEMDADARRFDQIQQLLTTTKLGETEAVRVIQYALQRGALDPELEDLNLFQRHRWPERTAYDLLISLCRLARSHSLVSREGMELVSQHLLYGRSALAKLLRAE
jgi:hypothetical protein